MGTNPSWAIEQVKGWASANTNSVSPQFKECLDITVALAEEALHLIDALNEIRKLQLKGA